MLARINALLLAHVRLRGGRYPEFLIVPAPMLTEVSEAMREVWKYTKSPGTPFPELNGQKFMGMTITATGNVRCYPGLMVCCADDLRYGPP